MKESTSHSTFKGSRGRTLPILLLSLIACLAILYVLRGEGELALGSDGIEVMQSERAPIKAQAELPLEEGVGAESEAGQGEEEPVRSPDGGERGSISVMVTNASGEPAEHVAIRLKHEDRGGEIQNRASGEDGSLSFGDLPAGDYEISVQLNEDHQVYAVPMRAGSSKQVTIAAGEAAELRFQVAQLLRVTFSVDRVLGEKDAGKLKFWYRRLDNWSSPKDLVIDGSDGPFVALIPPGRWEADLRFSPESKLFSFALEFEVRAGGEHHIEIPVFEGEGQLPLNFSTVDGVPIPGLEVSCTWEKEDLKGTGKIATTDEEGNLLFLGIPDDRMLNLMPYEFAYRKIELQPLGKFPGDHVPIYPSDETQHIKLRRKQK